MNAKPKTDDNEFRMNAAEFDRMMRGAMDAPSAKKAPTKKAAKKAMKRKSAKEPRK